jgi:ribose 5-phosphate isomerase B
MNIPIGCDANGFALKEHIKERLIEMGHTPIDFGCTSAEDAIDYPDVAKDLATSVADEHLDRGILICGTGIGMAIAANKVTGVRAACCHDPYSAERARKSNNAQILTLGAQIVGPEVADKLLEHWLASEFQGGRSARKVDKINEMDSTKGNK